MKKLYGAIEAGGTKFVCAVGTEPSNLKEVRFATTSPDETLAKAVDFFSDYRDALVALGVGSFGPVDLNPESKSYGYITTTPKPGWGNTDIVGILKRELGLPIGFDTDVNVAVLAETTWGAAKGMSDVVYITVGTGIGGGVMSGGKLVHGLVHPELGHMLVRKHPDDKFAGQCPFHQDACLEGLCSGPAIEARWQVPGSELPEDHPAWTLQAGYMAQAMVSIICMLSPQKIILGGGVMSQQHLLEKIRSETLVLLNGYIKHPSLSESIDQYIVSPGLGAQAGISGALMLAMQQGV